MNTVVKSAEIFVEPTSAGEIKQTMTSQDLRERATKFNSVRQGISKWITIPCLINF